MNIEHYWVKVLSTGYEEMYSTTWWDAMTGIVKGKLEVVEEDPVFTIGVANGTIPMPSIVRFKSGVFAAIYKRKAASNKKPHRRYIFARDEKECQYCGSVLAYDMSTVDHVIPKSNGGAWSWENLVLCCKPCNSKKANKDYKDVGLELRNKPKAPVAHYQNQALYKGAKKKSLKKCYL